MQLIALAVTLSVVVLMAACADDPIPSQTMAHMAVCADFAQKMQTKKSAVKPFADFGCVKYTEDDWRRYEAQRRAAQDTAGKTNEQQGDGATSRG